MLNIQGSISILLGQLPRTPEEWPQMYLTPPPFLVAALDVLLNDEAFALNDVQVRGLAVA
jgi:hypothetical protein